jgi:hypothetical protein
VDTTNITNQRKRSSDDVHRDEIPGGMHKPLEKVLGNSSSSDGSSSESSPSDEESDEDGLDKDAEEVIKSEAA